MAEIVRVGVRAGQLDTAALPRLTEAQAELMRAPSAGLSLQTTMTAVGATKEMQEQLRVPLGAIAQPLASDPVEFHPTDELTPILCRCKACSGYLNAYVRVDEHSGRWECNLCGELNELPPPSIASMIPGQHAPMPPGGGGGGIFGMFGNRGGQPETAGAPPQPERRADLKHGEVEYVLAGAEAQKYSPPELALEVGRMPRPGSRRSRSLVLAIDTSAGAYASGAVAAYCAAAQVALKKAASEAAAAGATLKIALLTYDQHVSAYHLRDGHAPSAHVLPVGPSEAMPTPPKHHPTFLVELADVLPVLEELLAKLADAAPSAADAEPAQPDGGLTRRLALPSCTFKQAYCIHVRLCVFARKAA